MTVHPLRSQASTRGNRMLRTALGPEIQTWLGQADIIEVMLNPDGRLWVDRLGSGMASNSCRTSRSVLLARSYAAWPAWGGVRMALGLAHSPLAFR